MARISYSQISMYSDCPLRWKWNYVDRLSISESNIHLIFGTAMHEVLQHYLNVMYTETVKNADEIDLDKIKFLASLPSLDEVRGKLVGLIIAPAQKLASILQEPGGQLARLISAHSESLGKSN